MSIETDTKSAAGKDIIEVQPLRKIRSLAEIKAEVGDFPRDKKVIMCHGTFDNVHVGHLRQLTFAKQKAPILVVSLTCERHVAKGPLRPYFTDEQRAFHLASLEYVDYVLIDQNATPIENLLQLQPDYFVKGYEYLRENNPKTQEEIDALKKYGGEMIFSPGDVVFSSSQILSSELKPKIPLERIQVIMREEKVDFCDLKDAVEKIRGIRINVVGDLIIDRYHYCTPPLGQSQEEEVSSYNYSNTEQFLGGSGVVAKHLSSLGAKVTLVTIIGNDEEGKWATDDLKASGVKLVAQIDKTRPTTVKERFVNSENGRLLFKANRLNNSSINDGVLKELCKTISTSKVDATIFSDFRHGIFNSRTIQMLVASIPPSNLKVADSQVSTRWGNILEFQGFDLITPNEREARWSLGDQDSHIRALAQHLYVKSGTKYLMLKLGKEGLLVYRSPGMESREYFYLESLAHTVIDHVGAGDALLAASTATLASSKNIAIASIVGNIAAALECNKRGNVPVSAVELTNAITKLEERVKGS